VARRERRREQRPEARIVRRRPQGD
jgi:hypothetical protein